MCHRKLRTKEGMNVACLEEEKERKRIAENIMMKPPEEGVTVNTFLSFYIHFLEPSKTELAVNEAVGFKWKC